ncbi:hypothetical protein NHX12_019796 [Muraenolepis orangiensis]|uniref:TLDc domain-containing protein n=1 Tax=Muraenolepis orangiensis TaxID=630683 RepID=A0A9Q0EUJ5_9TELE|nr:hypothetical protein NHX12_019796 [Muraenolepis orangiensis]
MAQSIRRSNTLGTMDHKLQGDKSRTGYFGNVKNRLASKLPASASRPQELSESPLEAEPRPRCATTEARDEGRHPHHTAAHHVHRIRNPKLRQYYMQGTSSELNTENGTQHEGTSGKTAPKDTVFSVTSQLDVHRASTGDSTTSAPVLDKGKKTSAAPGSSLAELKLSAADPRLKLTQPEAKSDLHVLPASPSPDAEYDKLLDVEAVPMPDGQLCLLTLPPECCQGEGPEAVPYLKLFCRYITDCKGVVSGILLVTSNKLFFDPCKSHPLVVEHGCEEYLLWKGKRSTLKTPPTRGGHATTKSDTTKQQAGALALAPAGPSDPRPGPAPGAHRNSGATSGDMSEAEKHLEAGGPPGTPAEGPALNSVAASSGTCGGQDAKAPELSDEAKPKVDDSCLRDRSGSAAPGGGPPSCPVGVMFVRLRTQRPPGKTAAGPQLGTCKTLARRDACSDELYAYLSRWRPEICVLEGGAEDREGEADDEEFVLIEDDKEDPTGNHRVSGEDWEMLSIENSGSKPMLVIDREPEGLADILEASCLLEASHVRELCTELPPRTIGHAWQLTYSTSRHGFSLKSLYRKLGATDSPVLIVIKDARGQVFGSFLSHPLRPSETFYGTGETFLFMLHPRFKCFRWTGENTFFIKGNLDSFAIGGGSGHFGLWLDETLYRGRSSPCYTFNNCCLSEVDDFHVIEMEVWTFS